MKKKNNLFYDLYKKILYLTIHTSFNGYEVIYWVNNKMSRGYSIKWIINQLDLVDIDLFCRGYRFIDVMNAFESAQKLLCRQSCVLKDPQEIIAINEDYKQYMEHFNEYNK